MARSSDAPLRGRPRDPDTDRRILDAALQLLGRDGFARMSMDAVAADAGVAKPTIYRRYPSKSDLAAAALAHLAASRDTSAPPRTGNLEHDLVAVLRHFKRGVDRPFGIALVGTVLAEEHDTPELLELYRRVIVHPRRAMLRDVLDAAVSRGDVPADADIDTAVVALIGSYYAAYLADGVVNEDWPERAVRAVLPGLRSPAE